MMLVTKMFQVKIGMRNIVIPGARMQTTVVTMLTAPRMMPSPPTIRPMIHRSAPAPGEWMASLSGEYAVQPKSAAPAGVIKPAKAINAPKTNSQNDIALSRGNATSGAPICNGSTMFEKPNTIGVA